MIYKAVPKEENQRIIEVAKPYLLLKGHGEKELDVYHAYYHWDLDNGTFYVDEDGNPDISIMSDDYILQKAHQGHAFWFA